MIFFTFLTLYDAIYNPVPDCGCFGDAIKLTNWATFYKNVILMVFVSIIFSSRKKFNPPFTNTMEYAIAFVVAAVFVSFSIYNYQHLPVIDFREWKVGNNMVPDEQNEADIYLTFRNKESGETKEYISPDYPWQDSVWMAEWEFVDQRVDESMMVLPHELVIEDEEGNTLTESFVNNIDFQFFAISYYLEESKVEAFAEMNELFERADHDGYSFIALTSSLSDEVDKFRKNLHPHMEVYFADDVVLKTIIRSNPGLMLMKDGVVLGKWHYNDLPEYDDLKSGYLQN
jgi:hypothetical protein